MKLHDVGHTYEPMEMEEGEEPEKHYPCARLPASALGNSPIDGTDFFLVVKARAARVDNDDESCDVEILEVAPVSNAKATALGAGSADDEDVAEGFRGAVKKAISSRPYPQGEED